MKSRNLKIKSRKNLLAAVIEVPNEGGKYPFVMLFHGFKGYKEEETYTELAKELCKVGIGSIRFDASGFGESGGTMKDDYRFSNYVEDAENVYKFLNTKKYVDTDKIGAYGQSMGGMQSIVFASRHPEIKACVSISSPDEIATTDELGNYLDQWKKDGFIRISSSKYGEIKVPYDFVVDAKKWKMSDCVGKIRCPLLMILGLSDVTVPPSETRKVFQAANEPKELLEIKGVDHFYKRQPEILDRVNKIIINFFRSHL